MLYFDWLSFFRFFIYFLNCAVYGKFIFNSLFFCPAIKGSRLARVANPERVSDEKEQIAKYNVCKTLMYYKTTISNLKKYITRKYFMVQLFLENSGKYNVPDPETEEMKHVN